MRLALVPALFLALAGSVAAPLPAAARVMDVAEEDRPLFSRRIQAEGFNCPEAKVFIAEGAAPRGSVIRVHCGPEGGDEVFGGFSYRFTIRTDGSTIVEEWD